MATFIQFVCLTSSAEYSLWYRACVGHYYIAVFVVQEMIDSGSFSMSELNCTVTRLMLTSKD